MVSYYGGKVDEKRKRKICRDCFVQAHTAQDLMLQKLKKKEPIYDQPLPILSEATVDLDLDSDEDDGAKTDHSSSDSELEIG